MRTDYTDQQGTSNNLLFSRPASSVRTRVKSCRGLLVKSVVEASQGLQSGTGGNFYFQSSDSTALYVNQCALPPSIHLPRPPAYLQSGSHAFVLCM